MWWSHRSSSCTGPLPKHNWNGSRQMLVDLIKSVCLTSVPKILRKCTCIQVSSEYKMCITFSNLSSPTAQTEHTRPQIQLENQLVRFWNLNRLEFTSNPGKLGYSSLIHSGVLSVLTQVHSGNNFGTDIMTSISDFQWHQHFGYGRYPYSERLVCWKNGNIFFNHWTYVDINYLWFIWLLLFSQMSTCTFKRDLEILVSGKTQ